MVLCLAAVGAGLVLLSGTALAFDLLGPPRSFSIQLGAEPGLAGGFLLLVGTVGFAATLAGRQEHLGSAREAIVFAFLVGLTLVPLAENLFTFFIAWETMSVAPGLLLVLDARAEARRAGLLYLVYANVSAFALLVGFLLWGDGLTPRLDDLLGMPLPLPAAILLVLGCMMKAGVMPFHYWLPEAHPQAPSHVSALMSGVMVALPVYVATRFLVPMQIDKPLATTVLLLGALSATLGALHGLHSRNIKRLLAFTTIAHMGVLFALVGLAMLVPDTVASQSFFAPAIAVYVLSHGWAKGSLFLIAGSIHHATGELDLDRLGGLARTMGPLAALAALASVALSGLPPTAGFPAELGVLTAFLGALPGLPPIDGVVVLGSLFLMAVGAGAGLAAAAKITLGAFHGPARGVSPPRPAKGLGGPAVLVALSLGVGILPGLPWFRLSAGEDRPWTLLTPLGEFTFIPLLSIGVLAAVLLWSVFGVRRATPSLVAPWACGLPPPGPRQAYTADGLVMPYRILFAEILRPSSDLSIQDAPVAPFAPVKGRYAESQPNYVEPWVHRPIMRFLVPPIERLRRLHRGAVQVYLIIALLVLIGLLYLLPVIP
ncbi:MAG TPA: proton-conducting transporter membrane subunit [Candidatus Thermoplasmatota archaeon]|nr:proton-conducting transporter membrane subunit [Candidatus Thermoplasmatota archaeon]